MTLNMRNYKGFNKDPYCEAHIPKAKATTVAETPELKRIAENTKLQSNAMYHADFEKAKGKLTQVADDPETLRIKQNSRIISNVAYHGDLQKKAAMEQKRNINGELADNTKSSADAENMNVKQKESVTTLPDKPIPNTTHLQGPNIHQNSPYSARQASTVIYTSERGPVNSPGGWRIGSIADLDPVNNYYGSLTSGQNDSAALQQPSSHQQHQVLQNHQHQQKSSQQQQPMYNLPPQGSGRVYVAIYDYEADDRDEVSFLDGDLIVDCTPVDQGWMTGVVERTGQMGMLPANYVKPAL
jgi:hypothetical protein